MRKSTVTEDPATTAPEAAATAVEAEPTKRAHVKPAGPWNGSDYEKGKRTADALARGPQFQVFIPRKKNRGGMKSMEADFVKLCSINGVAYWGKRGESKMVPLEVARIAYDAGILGESHPVPPGAGIPLDPTGEVPAALMEDRLSSMGVG